MAPKGRSITSALQLHAQYGQVLSQSPYAECLTGQRLHSALVSRGILASRQVCVTWINTYRNPVSANCITNAEELERLHGSAVRRIATEDDSAYKIVTRLRALEPPVFTTRAAVAAWQGKYGAIRNRFGAWVYPDGWKPCEKQFS